MIVIIPPKEHANIQLLINAGWLECKTFTFGGIQGVTKAGIQGISVIEQTPNVGIFNSGLKSMIEATG